MKVLISNDDGIFAPGIAALSEAFADAGYEVIVCAPDRQRSAASHALTISGPLTVRQAQVPGAVRAYAIGGTPADCVKLGLSELCPEAEAVISGVNHGYNTGSDILYSGTVAAAMEGALCGRPAMAVSQAYSRSEYGEAARMAARLFARMQENPLPPLRVLNLNYPACDGAKGPVAARMEQMHYSDDYARTQEESGCVTYALGGAVDAARRQSDDYEKLSRGLATVTVLHCDLTDEAGSIAWDTPV